MEEKYRITGQAGESPYDDFTPNHLGKIVTKFRRCIGEDTTICVTEDGKKLWVPNDGLEKVS